MGHSLRSSGVKISLLTPISADTIMLLHYTHTVNAGVNFLHVIQRFGILYRRIRQSPRAGDY